MAEIVTGPKILRNVPVMGVSNLTEQYWYYFLGYGHGGPC